MKRPIIGQYSREYMRHYPEDHRWVRYEQLKAIQGLKRAYIEEVERLFEKLGIFKLMDWMNSKLKNSPE